MEVLPARKHSLKMLASTLSLPTALRNMLTPRIRIGNLDLIWKTLMLIWIKWVEMLTRAYFVYLTDMAENKLQSIVQKRSLLS